MSAAALGYQAHRGRKVLTTDSPPNRAQICQGGPCHQLNTGQVSWCGCWVTLAFQRENPPACWIAQPRNESSSCRGHPPGMPSLRAKQMRAMRQQHRNPQTFSLLGPGLASTFSVPPVPCLKILSSSVYCQ